MEKKKFKKDKRLLLISPDCESNKGFFVSLENLQIKIRAIMREHIGENNPITPYELFEFLIGKSPIDYPLYEREYLWNVIKKVIRHMRFTEEVFIINKGQYLFVLQSEKEYLDYKSKCNIIINNFKSLKKKAKRWVENKSWKKLNPNRDYNYAH